MVDGHEWSSNTVFGASVDDSTLSTGNLHPSEFSAMRKERNSRGENAFFAVRIDQ
jgi:hypothetical protein